MKKFLSFIAVSIVATSLFAFSWNGVFDNNTKLSTNDFMKMTLTQSNGIFLSANAPINEALRFSAEGLYKYNLDVAEKTTKFTNIADVDLLKLSGIWKLSNSNIALDFGRFIISDLASTVFTQTSDGVNVKYETAKWKAGLYAGYTGLLNSLNVSMVDYNDKTNDFYRLSVGYVPLSANFAYTSLFGSNVIGAQFFYFLGLEEKLTDKLYGEFTLSGPVFASGSYSAAVVTGVNLNEKKDFMLYAKADYSAFLAGKVIVGAGAEFANKEFRTITSKSLTCLGGNYSGVLVPKVNGMLVFNNFVGTVAEKIVFVTPESSLKYAGIDSSLSALFNVFSDLQVGCDVAAYFGKTPEEKFFSVTAKATLAF